MKSVNLVLFGFGLGLGLGYTLGDYTSINLQNTTKGLNDKILTRELTSIKFDNESRK